MSSQDPLERVRIAASRKESADREYRSALVSAHAAGSSYAAIAAAAGTSRQRVRQLLGRLEAPGESSD